MLLSLSVNNQSVDSSGITTDYKEAINEFIWNGFEANATVVDISFIGNGTGGISEILIRDNGDGINYDELHETFGAFLTSKKRLLSIKAKSKINKGKGRFSFTAFADNAVWKTVYQSSNGLKKYTITMDAAAKDIVDCSDPEDDSGISTGTEVVFTNISALTEDSLHFDILESSLLKEFAWFLYLYRDKKLTIVCNGVELDFKKFIDTDNCDSASKTIDGHAFDISLIVWQKNIREKFCCYYFDSSNTLRGKNTTTHNRNTIDFNHSVYVKSAFFDNHTVMSEDCDELQTSMFESAEEGKQTLRKLNKAIKTLIEKRMSIYLAKRADRVIEEMVAVRKTFPTFSDDRYGQIRKNDLKRVTKAIYRIEPMLFHRLKPIQEKSLLGFLNLLLSSEERENVLSIIEQVVELTPEQRCNLADMLRKTSLENVIDTIRFLEDRFRVIEILRSIVFDLAKYANERDHIQKLVEQHFWLFGEQYNLASADKRMKDALERYLNILYGEKTTASLNPDAENERRMDIFLCNNRNVETSLGAVQDENIIVELKAPTVVLSKKVFRQIEDYMDFIMRQPAFTSLTRKWKFIAVCREVDDDIKNLYKTFEDKGNVGLVHKVGDYEIYAFTWGDVFHSFEMRFAPLLEKLKYDREQIANELSATTDHADGRERVDNLVEQAVSE